MSNDRGLESDIIELGNDLKNERERGMEKEMEKTNCFFYLFTSYASIRDAKITQLPYTDVQLTAMKSVKSSIRSNQIRT